MEEWQVHIAEEHVEWYGHLWQIQPATLNNYAMCEYVVKTNF